MSITILPAASDAPAEPEPVSATAPGDVAGVLRLSAMLVGLLSVAGFAMAAGMHSISRIAPNTGNIFYALYALHERPFFALTGIFAAFVWWYARSVAGARARSDALAAPTARRFAVPLLAALTGLVAVIGSTVVMHDFAFAMDEFNAVFQAEIFAGGRVAAPLAPAWQPYGKALAPVFTTYYATQHVWRSGYLPVYAAMRVPFQMAGLGSWANPVFAVLTVLALAAVGRRLWPGRERRTLYAVLLLATSSQFLFNSMTRYSMPAHLLLNTVWLWLYLRDDALGLGLAPVVGVLALGLHNPFPHALFVAPFLLTALLRKRFRWLTYAGVVYGAGALVWYLWLHASSEYLAATGGGLLSTFGLPHKIQFVTQALSLTLLLSWLPPLASVLAIAALLRWRHLGQTERDLAAGLLLTAAFHFFFPLSQGHGWGYRYLYSALANVAILAATAADWGAESFGARRFGRLMAASTLLALAVELPLRAVRIERFVRPFARASEYVAARPEPVVITYPDSSYYGRDLVRNDPYLRNSPKVLAAPLLGDSGVQRLVERYHGNVYFLRPAVLRRIGVPTVPE